MQVRRAIGKALLHKLHIYNVSTLFCMVVVFIQIVVKALCYNHINYALQASFTVLLKRGHLKLPRIQCRYALRRNG